jgi:hypothetical protein
MKIWKSCQQECVILLQLFGFEKKKVLISCYSWVYKGAFINLKKKWIFPMSKITDIFLNCLDLHTSPYDKLIMYNVLGINFRVIY